MLLQVEVEAQELLVELLVLEIQVQLVLVV